MYIEFELIWQPPTATDILFIYLSTPQSLSWLLPTCYHPDIEIESLNDLMAMYRKVSFVGNTPLLVRLLLS